MVQKKMKLILTLAFTLVYFSSLCTSETHSCEKQTDPSGQIYQSFYEPKEKCWIITVPEGKYVRLFLKEIKFDGWSCKQIYVKVTVVGTKEEYTFCAEDTNRKPITVMNDVRVTYYRSMMYSGRSTSFFLNYTTGTRVAAIKGVNVSRENAVTWLKGQRSDSNGWGKNTHRAITALYLSGGATFRGGDMEEKLIAKQLELQAAVALFRNSSDAISVNELSMFINALTVTFHSPRQFYGHNLLKILSERVLTLSSASPGAYLTLCNANWTIPDAQIKSLLDILDIYIGYPFYLDIQAMSLMALTCIKNKGDSFSRIEKANETYDSAVKDFISLQQRDGSFGNVYTTAMVTQALLSSGQESNDQWNVTSTVQYLIRKLNSTSMDFLSVYFAAPIFNGKTLVDLDVANCDKPGKEDEDEEISDIISKFGEKMQVKYYLYIGNNKDVVHSVYLKVPENSTAYDVMRVAQVADPKYKFLHSDVSGYIYVYEIAGITNDPEAAKFWLLYTKDSTGNGTLVPHIESPDEVYVNDGDHLIMWYKTAQV